MGIYASSTDTLKNLFQCAMNAHLFYPWKPKDSRGPYEIMLESYIKHYFPIIYSGLIIFTIFGVIYQFVQLIPLVFLKKRPLYMWRARVLYGFSEQSIRYIRLVGCLLMIGSWLMLYYGLATISSNWLTYWLYVSFTSLLVDYVLWCVELIFHQQQFKFLSLLNFLVPFLTQFLVWRVKILMENATVKESGWFFYYHSS